MLSLIILSSDLDLRLMRSFEQVIFSYLILKLTPSKLS